MTLAIHRVTPDDWHRDLRLEMLQAAPTRSSRSTDVAGSTRSPGAGGSPPSATSRRGWTTTRWSVGVWDDPETPDDASTLVAMYVAPRAGRRGGRTLVRAVFEEAAARGRSRVVLEVTEGNDPAIGLYRRMGFDFDGTRHPFPRKPHLQELGMEKVLDTPLEGPPTTWRLTP